MKKLYILLTVLFLMFGLGCSGNDSDGSSDIKLPFYSEKYDMSQSKSPALFSSFMTGLHLDYQVFGWDYFAKLDDGTNNPLAFFFAIEYTDGKGYRGGVGFNSNDSGGYVMAGFNTPTIEITKNPWSAKLTSPDNPESYIMLTLVSGLMGEANAVYRLNADVLDLIAGKSLKVDVLLRDPFGAINQGYGTTSFYPHYITDAQRNAILSLPERTLGAYVAATGDPMTCQGDYYYAIPLMEVEQFTIEYDGAIKSGKAGHSWVDYFVQSFTPEYYQMVNNSTWQWMAIQLPEINTAINILKITNQGGTLPYARLFNTDSERTRNGIRKASHSWAIDEISIEPVPGSEWTIPTGQTFYEKYKVTLQSETWPGELTVTLLRKNQIVALEEGVELQGLASVEGILNGKTVHGQAWIEVQPVQPATP